MIQHELVPDMASSTQSAELHNIAMSVAFEAPEATYSFLYNKACRFQSDLVREMPIPSISHTSFPIYIAVFANSIGPVRLESIPARGQHIPLLYADEVEGVRPAGYDMYLTSRFREKSGESTRVLALVDPSGSDSSAWWTFWVTKNSTSTTSDLNSTDENSMLNTYTLWSPVK